VTTPHRERIMYRVVARGSREHSFLPPGGIGYGLDDTALGMVLNRIMKGPRQVRTIRKTIIGVVLAEDSEYVTIERDGHLVKIPYRGYCSKDFGGLDALYDSMSALWNRQHRSSEPFNANGVFVVW
jgi:hypothetical protein